MHIRAAAAAVTLLAASAAAAAGATTLDVGPFRWTVPGEYRVFEVFGTHYASRPSQLVEDCSFHVWENDTAGSQTELNDGMRQLPGKNLLLLLAAKTNAGDYEFARDEGYIENGGMGVRFLRGRDAEGGTPDAVFALSITPGWRAVTFCWREKPYAHLVDALQRSVTLAP